MTNIQQEIWKDVVGYEGTYQISSIGRVKSSTTILKIATNYLGYHHLRLGSIKNKNKKSFTVHRLVAIAFIDNPYNYNEVNHINGIKTDNRLENLEWCTRKENMQHALKNGLWEIRFGENARNVKITENDVIEIRRLFSLKSQNGLTCQKIADKYGMSYSGINEIVNRKTWKHI